MMDTANTHNLIDLSSHVFFGSPFEALAVDDKWNEIWINRWDNIWIDRNSTIERVDGGFGSQQDFHQWCVRLQDSIQVEISLDRPFGNAQIHSLRFHLVHPSLGGGQCLIAIRRLGHLSHSLEQLMGLGWCTAEQQQCLQRLILERQSLLFIGATGAGKTTAMNACLKEIGPMERSVLIEDTPELSLPNPLSVRLETRPAVDGGLSEVTYRHLIREALRMRPDRLVIGEVRSGESADLLLALSTGHKGSVCTLHAENAAAALSRLEVLASMGAPTWGIGTIRELIFHGLSAVIVCERDQKSGARKLGGVFQIQSIEPTGLIVDQIA